MRAWHVSTLFIHRKPHTTTIPVNLRAIPEVREWFAQLFMAWPYWSFFASRIDQTVPLVLTLLLSGETVAGEPGMAGWSFDIDELKPLLLEMFCHPHELIERLKIDEEVNERVTQDFMEAVRVFSNQINFCTPAAPATTRIFRAALRAPHPYKH